MFRSSPISNFNRSSKNVQLQIIRLTCIFGLVIAATVFFMNSTWSTLDPENSIPQLLKLQLKSIKKPANNNNMMKSKVINIQGKPLLYTNVDLKTIVNKLTVTELNLNYIQIDPQSFTESLIPFLNLKTIKLDHVKLTTPDWNFQPVDLPNLEEFYINLNIGFHDQYTDYMKDLTEENMSKLIFYTKNSQNTSNSETDLANKLSQGGVKVTIRADGWSVLCLQPSKTEVNSYETIIAVDFADKVLTKLKENLNIVHLTMTECFVSKSSFPTQLQYLNLYRVNITEGDITEVLDLMTNLTELFLELRNGTLKMSSIPKSVKTLAISDIDAMYDSEETSSVETVAFGFPQDPDIIANFDKIFINVKKVSIFEPTNGTQYLLLQSVLKSHVEWVYFEGFERTENAIKTTIEQEIEAFLEGLKVKSDERQALIVRTNSTSTWKQEKLTKEQQLDFRYQMLGWDEYITWETYVANFLPKS